MALRTMDMSGESIRFKDYKQGRVELSLKLTKIDDTHVAVLLVLLRCEAQTRAPPARRSRSATSM